MLLIAFRIFFILSLPISITEGNESRRIPVQTAFNGELETHMLGRSPASPPYVKVIRSGDGIDHMLSSFSSIRNYQTFKKLRWLKTDMKRVDLNKNMLIAILSDPIDNYYMEFKGLYKVDNERLEVRLSYYHIDDVAYSITPKKNIYYKILVVRKSELPVILKTEDASVKNEKKVKPPLRYISGKLFAGKKDEVRLISPRRRKGMIYYIRGDWAVKLKEYTGKKVTLRGRVYNMGEGIYEMNFEVDKLIKVHETKS